MVEVKHYTARWAPLEDFTAVTTNLTTNMQTLTDLLTRTVAAPPHLRPPELRGLNRGQIRALRKKVIGLKGAADAMLEVRTGPSTRLGGSTQTARGGTALQKLKQRFADVRTRGLAQRRRRPGGPGRVVRASRGGTLPDSSTCTSRWPRRGSSTGSSSRSRGRKASSPDPRARPRPSAASVPTTSVGAAPTRPRQGRRGRRQDGQGPAEHRPTCGGRGSRPLEVILDRSGLDLRGHQGPPAPSHPP